jgi:hypothetical protein
VCGQDFLVTFSKKGELRFHPAAEFDQRGLGGVGITTCCMPEHDLDAAYNARVFAIDSRVCPRGSRRASACHRGGYRAGAHPFGSLIRLSAPQSQRRASGAALGELMRLDGTAWSA